MIRSELDVLLDKIEDLALQADLRAQIDRLKRRRSFGLVFEQHIPERVRLPQHPIRVGSRVVSRDDDDSPTFEVVAMEDGVATLEPIRDPDGAYIPRGDHTVGDYHRAPLDSLVVITDFGEPVLPGFRYLGAVERGGDKPYHVVINGENHHALEALRFTHAGKVDCIYIDPPYNSGARDWKYNNDYVDETDAYRHSKWLAFMERRLKLAKELLNPDDSVLIVTIDEREVHRLGLLLGQTFPEARIQMVSSVTNPGSSGRLNEFSRTDEYIFFVMLGAYSIQGEERANTALQPIYWRAFQRANVASVRGSRPNQFYPVYVNSDSGRIEHVGDPVSTEVEITSVPSMDGCDTVWPIRPDGTEMTWCLTPGPFRALVREGFVKVGGRQLGKPQQWPIYYLTSGVVRSIREGKVKIAGRGAGGEVIAHYEEPSRRMPTTNWNRPSHNARSGGTELLKALLSGPRFPFPKSLYAVEDTIRFFVKDKPNAVVLDFFAGSGTTAHAVMRLNKQDGGRRQSIMVTNNEVSADEAADLRNLGIRPGDPEWEAAGIFEHITRPRVTAAITGKTPEGEAIKGDYKFTDEVPMAGGFDENAAFLELRYLDADDVDLGLAYDDIAPLLWLRAGATGPIAKRNNDAGNPLPYAWTERYGVLFDEDRWRAFVSECPETATAAFIVTNSPTTFAGIVAELPTNLDTVRLYDTYLSMFQPDRSRA